MIARSLYRSLRVLEHLLTGASIALYVRLRHGKSGRPHWLPAVVRWWHGRLCRALGVRLEIQGNPAPGCLLVGNHISWLDIPVIGAQTEMGFLSKSEVREWPLIGWMSEVAGTRFIERGGNRSEQVLTEPREDLARGQALMIFPEGTTTDGRRVRRFHPRLLAVARDNGVGIQPIALSYHKGEDPAPDTDVPYVGDDTLIANLWRLVRHPGLTAAIHFLPPIESTGPEQRRVLAERARTAIETALGLTPLTEQTTLSQPIRSEAVNARLEPSPI